MKLFLVSHSGKRFSFDFCERCLNELFITRLSKRPDLIKKTHTSDQVVTVLSGLPNEMHGSNLVFDGNVSFVMQQGSQGPHDARNPLARRSFTLNPCISVVRFFKGSRVEPLQDLLPSLRANKRRPSDRHMTTRSKRRL